MLANFSDLKKYSLENPAWFNNDALKLKEQRMYEGMETLYLQHYLWSSNGDLDELKLKLGIYTTRHPELPLVIFNYDHVKTPHDSLLGLECRGLVLEKDTWNIVAKPMNRFFNWEEIDIEAALHPNFEKRQFDFTNFTTQSKEDGSLIVMYFYQGHWRLNTRTFFLNNDDQNKVVMSGIHEVPMSKVIGTFLKALKCNAKTLDDLDEFLNRTCTYCFEFCSSFNKIVRTYEEDTVFLLSITENKTLKEANPLEVDRVSELIGAKRPINHKFKTLEDIIQAMKEVIKKDPSLEGFVIRDVNGTRWKIKSPSYFFLHHISYDKMRTPYPKDLVPLILQGEGTELFSILEINGFIAELYEIQQQWKFCENRLNQAWQQLQKDWEKVIKIENQEEFNKQISTLTTPLICLLKELYSSNKKELTDLENIWYHNPNILVDKLFTIEEQRPPNIRKAQVKVEHINSYQKAQKREESSLRPLFKNPDWWKQIKEENDGLAKVRPHFEDGKWNVSCFCGEIMPLYSVPEYWYDYKCARAPLCDYCKTSIVDKKKENGNLQDRGGNAILTYQCKCGLSHRAHQHQKKIDNELKRRPLKGKPLGIPCSELCLCMRHLAHEEIENIMKEFKWDRDQIYREAAKILNVNMEDSHVGMLGISQCRTLIIEFREMRG